MKKEGFVFNNYVELPKDDQPKFLGIFTKDKTFYKTFFPLLLIIALQQLAALTVNLVDNMMLGRYTELALNGATLVNQLQFMLQQIISYLGIALVVLASQYWGQKRLEPIKKIISLGLKVGFGIGVIFFVVTLLLPSQVLGIFTNDAAVIEEGVKYLRIMCWTYLIFAASNTLMFAMQSVETAFIGTVMSCSTICINLCLNSILIYGNLGAPELGIRGAAIATLVSRTVELVIILVYILFIDKKLRMKLHDILQMNFEYLKDFVKVATPVVISGCLWGVAQAAQTVILGHISSSVLAANSIAIVIFQLFVVFGFANANVASIMMGKTIGEGKLHLVKTYTKTMQGLFILIGIASAILMFALKDVIVGFYSVSPEAREYAVSFIIILAVTSIGSCYEYPVESGIIAGGGTTKYAPLVDNLFMWLFTIPFSALSAFVFHFPPVVTFCVLKADQFLKCIPNSINVNRYKWVKILTRDDESPAP